MGFGILATLFPPRKTAVTLLDAPAPDVDVDKEEYLALAKRAGFGGAVHALSSRAADKNRARDVGQLRQFLAENGICVYNARKVRRYMDSITRPGERWYWEEAVTYIKLIPSPVLITMAKIREAFPKATFQVTDIVDEEKGDPFLRVTLHEERFIIERWDEPGFRM